MYKNMWILLYFYRCIIVYLYMFSFEFGGFRLLFQMFRVLRYNLDFYFFVQVIFQIENNLILQLYSRFYYFFSLYKEFSFYYYLVKSDKGGV